MSWPLYWITVALVVGAASVLFGLMGSRISALAALTGMLIALHLSGRGGPHGSDESL